MGSDLPLPLDGITDELRDLRRGLGLGHPPAVLEFSAGLRDHLLQRPHGDDNDPAQVHDLVAALVAAIDELDHHHRVHARVELNLDPEHSYPTLTGRRESLALALGRTSKTVRRHADRSLHALAVVLAQPKQAKLSPEDAGPEDVDHGQPATDEDRPVSSPDPLRTGAVVRVGLLRPVASFFGREHDLAALGKAVASPADGRVRFVAITGLGGVGKSQLAARFVHEVLDEFDVVAWLRHWRHDLAGLRALAAAFELTVEGRTEEALLRTVTGYLATTPRRWLLVVDDIDGPRALESLPAFGRGAVVATSRRSGGYEAFGHELHLSPFSEDAATAFLLQRSGRSEARSDAQAIAEMLGGLPLALDHAAVYCSNQLGITFSDYLELLSALPVPELFDSRPEAFYEHAVAATWQPSIDQAADNAPLARDVLAMAAYLAPDQIDPSLFAVLAPDTALGRRTRSLALRALSEYSLLGTHDDGRVSIHRLVQRVVRDSLTPHQQATALRSVLDSLEPGDLPAPDDDVDSWPEWQQRFLHLREIARLDLRQAVAEELELGRRLVDALLAACEYVIASGAMSTAGEFAAQTLLIAESVASSSEDLPMVRARAYQAEITRITGDIDAAIAAQEKLIQLDSRLAEIDQVLWLRVRTSLIRSYEASRRTAEAIEHGERLVADMIELVGSTGSETSAARTEPAGPNVAEGQARRAVDALEPVVVSQRDTINTPIELLSSQNHLANAYRGAGRMDDAIWLGEELIQRLDRGYGPEHPQSMSARFGLASTYRCLGRIAEAIAIEEDLVACSSEVLGDQHPNIISARANLGLSYQSLGATDQAIKIAEAVLHERDALMGADTPPTLTAMANLAISYRAEGRLEDSIAILSQVVESRTRVLGAHHFATCSARNHLGISLLQNGDTRAALATLGRAFADRTRGLGPDHPATLITGDNLATAYRVGREFTEAATLGRRMVDGLERVLGPEHPDTLWSRHHLAWALALEDERADALLVMEGLVDSARKRPGDQHPFTRWAGELDHAIRTRTVDEVSDFACERILWE